MKVPLPDDFSKYMIKVTPSGDWVSYRHRDYSPHSASREEGRFNVRGEVAYYAASGIPCAQAEVPNYDERICYQIKSGIEIMAFSIPAYAEDYGCTDLFLKSEEDGGYSVCQELADYLKAQAPYPSGIVYQSHPLDDQGAIGHCMVILPSGDQEIESGLFERKKTDI